MAKIVNDKVNNNTRSIISCDFNDVVSNDLMEKFWDIVVTVDRGLNKYKIRATISYDGYAITEGRNEIRNLVRNRTMSNLSYSILKNSIFWC